MKLTKFSTKDKSINRRTFLKRSTLSIGGITTLAGITPNLVKKVQADETKPSEIKTVRTICTDCAMGCGVIAEVQNGVWIGQEPAFDHPFNLGSYCARGASLRQSGQSTKRLKYPLKLEKGKWKRVSWDQAIGEISQQLLTIREQIGPDSVYWLGSAKFNNEQAYLYRKLAALWGTNNIDQQARLSHASTVAGVSETWGMGAATNSYNDIHHSKTILIIGSNPAESSPVAMQHIFRAKERGAQLIVVDPRFTRTAAHADHFVRLRPGSDVALIWGILWHLFENQWEDVTFIQQRVYGMSEIRAEVAKWSPDEVEKVTGVAEAEVKKIAQLLADNRPGAILWALGATQHANSVNYTRAYCILQLALGNIGISGGGIHLVHLYDNLQGATDLGLSADTLPGYYGLTESAWKHWAAVWDIDYEWLSSRFAMSKATDSNSVSMMHASGIPASRWMDGVLENKDNLNQTDNLKAALFWGHSPNTHTRGADIKKALDALNLIVVIDSHVNEAAILSEHTDNVYLLPACTQFETYGSVTAVNRSIQWRDQVIAPLFEALPDHVIMYKLAKALGFSQQLCQQMQVKGDEPVIEDVTREINKGMWSIGYTGQSPERLKSHQQNWGIFNTTTLRAEGTAIHNEVYGLPWPCWGTPELKHPGTPILYDVTQSVMQGGSSFQAKFGSEYEGSNLLAEEIYPIDSEIQTGYEHFSADSLKQQGWWNELTPAEKKSAQDKDWQTDLSGGIQRVAIQHGCLPSGNAKARCVVWHFPDPVPVHREPLYSNQRELVKKYPTYADYASLFRLPTQYQSIQQIDYTKDFPLMMITGCLAEYQGSGDESRSNKGLAELQSTVFIEMNPVDVNNYGANKIVWIESIEGNKMKAQVIVTQRVAAGVVFIPFQFSGCWQGHSLQAKYPENTEPYVLGDACNHLINYGYEPVTGIAASKMTLCKVYAA